MNQPIQIALIKIALTGVVLMQLQGCATPRGDSNGAAVTLDRRTAGVYIGDQEIELRARSRLSEAIPGSAGSVSATSYNRQVLLTGQVRDEAVRARAGEIAKGVPDVRTVFNELSISTATSLASTTNDAGITSLVKARLLRNESAPATKIKVVTEANVVYLMGLVTPEEARIATDIARTTSGVSKVVTLFEPIN